MHKRSLSQCIGFTLAPGLLRNSPSVCSQLVIHHSQCKFSPPERRPSWLILLIREESGIGHVDPVTTVKSGKSGRPRKEIDVEFLQDAMSSQRRISISTLARTLGIDRHVLSRRLKEAGISTKFSALRKSDLDELVKGFRTTKPESGLRYLAGFLRQRGLKIQKRRVTASVKRVDGLGRILRQRHKIKRRTYKVSRPNALWHIDGHHKLILWGFVIHGIIDGCAHVVGSICPFKSITKWFLGHGLAGQYKQ